MIGGQYLDIAGGAPDLASLHRLKTGCLFSASVACALWVAEVPEREQARGRLEETKDPDEAIEILQELSQIAKEVESQLQQAKRETE